MFFNIVNLQQSEAPPHSTKTRISNPTLGKVTTAISGLDFASALKASRTISEDIELEALLSKLMHIVAENAGADKGTLILNNGLNNGEIWEIVAQCDRQKCNLHAISLDLEFRLNGAIVIGIDLTWEPRSTLGNCRCKCVTGAIAPR